MNKYFTDEAWNDYLYWETQDHKTLKKINRLIKDIDRHPFEGIGKPKPLKFKLAGIWSRRITDKDRIVYMVTEDAVHYLSLRDHY